MPSDDQPGDGQKAPFCQPEDASALVRRRRRGRRLKAGLSVGLALMAGAFLSCQRAVGHREAADPPANQEEPRQPAPQPAPASAPSKEAPTTDGAPPAEPSQAQDAGVPAAESTADAGQGVDADAPDAKEAKEAKGAKSAADAGQKKDAALEKRPKPRRKRPAVDIREHRKGMPVPDNLLE